MHPAMHWRQYIDFELFETNLLQASRNTFSAVQRDHPYETFYAFALYKSPLLEGIVPTSNSEEGLEKVIDKHRHLYAARKWKFNDNEKRISLRWETPADWFYHLYNQEGFELVNTQLLETGYLGHVLGHDDFFRFLEYADEIMYRVLMQLDSEGLFGVGSRRNRVIVNIMMGDEHYGSRLENAKRLNPHAAYIWYKADLEKLYPPRQSFISRLFSHL